MAHNGEQIEHVFREGGMSEISRVFLPSVSYARAAIAIAGDAGGSYCGNFDNSSLERHRERLGYAITGGQG